MDRLKENRQVRLICLALALGTFFVYCQMLAYGYISYDDEAYVRDNFNIYDGFSLRGLVWAFTNAGYAANWHPLTWISHMLDCQIFGVNHPGGHHFVNLLLHIANALLLFLLLRRMTGAMWRSAIVAALFAWHPLHVESVAWIAERKDVLSTFFWMLTVLSYVRYVEQSKIKGQKSKLSYALALVWFALGLMSKPMVVTLPFALLLIDFWPLGRIAEFSQICRLLVEKIPFVVLSLAASVVTYQMQKTGGAVSSFEAIPFAMRIENVLVSYVRYLGKMLWPANLAIFYPMLHWASWQWLLAGTLLAAITVFVIITMRRWPWLFTGWFWYVGMLVPVIGLVQVGMQSMADRYAYLPAVGIFIAVVWSGGALLERAPGLRLALFSITSLALSCFLMVTFMQVGYWTDTLTLFTHSLDVTPVNAIALNNLGKGLDEQGRINEAMACFEKSLAIEPQMFLAHSFIGQTLAREGRNEEAVAHYKIALQDRDRPITRFDLGNALTALGRYKEAGEQYSIALRSQPNWPDLHNNYGAVLMRQSRWDEAAAQFEIALQLKPNYPEVHDELGSVRQEQGRLDDALFHFGMAARQNPGFAHARFRLGMLLAEHGKVSAAIPQLEAAARLGATNANYHFNLGAAYAAVGDWNSAVQSFGVAARLKPNDAETRKRLAEARAHTGAAQR